MPGRWVSWKRRDAALAAPWSSGSESSLSLAFNKKPFFFISVFSLKRTQEMVAMENEFKNLKQSICCSCDLQQWLKFSSSMVTVFGRALPAEQEHELHAHTQPVFRYCLHFFTFSFCLSSHVGGLNDNTWQKVVKMNFKTTQHFADYFSTQVCIP